MLVQLPIHTIKRYLHLADNRQLEEGNKTVAKVKPPCTEQKSETFQRFPGTFVADWRFHCQGLGACTASALSHREFRRQVAMNLILSQKYSRAQLGGGPQGSLPVTVQYDGHGHIRAPCYQGCCRVCQNNTRVMCLQCKALLHSDRSKDCFGQFHTQQKDITECQA